MFINESIPLVENVVAYRNFHPKLEKTKTATLETTLIFSFQKILP